MSASGGAEPSNQPSQRPVWLIDWYWSLAEWGGRIQYVVRVNGVPSELAGLGQNLLKVARAYCTHFLFPYAIFDDVDKIGVQDNLCVAMINYMECIYSFQGQL